MRRHSYLKLPGLTLITEYIACGCREDRARQRHVKIPQGDQKKFQLGIEEKNHSESG